MSDTEPIILDNKTRKAFAQVMIGSTSLDLPDRRKHVKDAILDMGCFPLASKVKPVPCEAEIRAAIAKLKSEKEARKNVEETK